MYNITRSHQGSALLVGLVITILLTILTTSFLDKILGLGKTSKGIDSSAQSYSLATGLIEEQLMNPVVTKEEPWRVASKSETGSTATGRYLAAYTGSSTMPQAGKGNSPFSTDWNVIGMGEPVQIVIPEGINWAAVNFHFRVPDVPGAVATTTGVVATMANSGIILWTFGYSGASLYASGESQIFKGSDIITSGRPIDTYNGNTSTGTSATFNAFYANNVYGVGAAGAKCTGYKCTLKLSMIRPVVTTGGQSFSFLEYQIVFPAGVNLPSQYMVIDSSAYVLGYLRSRQVRIPQITTDTANDFAVLQ